ncbi:endonuclease VII domain-containing protein [Streptomyces sp. NPDC056401]|uniref:endonuclease VII domain-containing protein n=1 Tax=Streptomyces sp. NPDC056401 TaxID=3345809 RepID=UPI0035D838EB
MAEGEKRCARCEVIKPLDAFASNRSRPDGLQYYCRPCVAEYHQQRQIAKGKNVRPRVEAPVGHKYCRRCKEIKPHSEWDRNKTASDGRSTRCKACRAVESRAGHLKRSYGMTEADRDEMIAAQGGICLICKKRAAVHVDHCHTTGRVRGVLCFNCNTAIGKLGDDPDAARRVVSYLEGNLWNPTFEAQGVCRQPS